MKAVLIISSLLLTVALGDVVTNTYGTYLQTPDAITKTARSDTGYSYSVTSTRGHPSDFLYGVQQIGTPLALTYSSLGVNHPFGYITQNVLPYDYTTKHLIPKIVIPYSTLALSPLVSQLSAIYQTSSIPSLLQDNMKSEDAKKPAVMEQPMMMDQKPMPQNPFFSAFVQMNNEMPQQNPVATNDQTAPSLQGNKVDDDTVSVESA
ncbi:uncharacterized protein LOC123317663 [Coccinella septempunctata]|uniref:uncharacterized protein LOC123317663 n=1 Tax=Coccinella septempunctata TaxID=41139 RepID=UPI001D065990|nr:uncharacterized protein LOC123317663 [Coccinella septempunctata]